MRYEHCVRCGEEIDPPERGLIKNTCLWCGEEAARMERASWCVLTPHKQGAIYVTKEAAKALAVGVNNKGGLVK